MCRPRADPYPHEHAARDSRPRRRALARGHARSLRDRRRGRVAHLLPLSHADGDAHVVPDVGECGHPNAPRRTADRYRAGRDAESHPDAGRERYRHAHAVHLRHADDVADGHVHAYGDAYPDPHLHLHPRAGDCRHPRANSHTQRDLVSLAVSAADTHLVTDGPADRDVSGDPVADRDPRAHRHSHRERDADRHRHGDAHLHTDPVRDADSVGRGIDAGRYRQRPRERGRGPVAWYRNSPLEVVARGTPAVPSRGHIPRP